MLSPSTMKAGSGLMLDAGNISISCSNCRSGGGGRVAELSLRTMQFRHV